MVTLKTRLEKKVNAIEAKQKEIKNLYSQSLEHNLDIIVNLKQHLVHLIKEKRGSNATVTSDPEGILKFFQDYSTENLAAMQSQSLTKQGLKIGAVKDLPSVDPAMSANGPLHLDAYVRECMDLISHIYQLAKIKNISSKAFEAIIFKSYDRAWKGEEATKLNIGSAAQRALDAQNGQTAANAEQANQPAKPSVNPQFASFQFPKTGEQQPEEKPEPKDAAAGPLAMKRSTSPTGQNRKTQLIDIFRQQLRDVEESNTMLNVAAANAGAPLQAMTMKTLADRSQNGARVPNEQATPTKV